MNKVTYGDVQEIINDLSLLIEPPARITPTEAAEKYFKLQEGGTFDVGLTPYMAEPMDMLASRDHSSVVFVGPARTGKGSLCTTVMPTPIGYTTMGTLQTGDWILGDDGYPVRVIGKSPVMHKPCYRVTFDTGDLTEVTDDHLWAVQQFSTLDGAKLVNFEVVKETSEMVKDFKYSGTDGDRYKYGVANAKPLELPHAELPLDPYILGLWLGSGCDWSGILTIATEDFTTIKAQLGNLYKSHSPGTGLDSVIVSTKDLKPTLNKMGLLRVKEDELPSKHIPIRYLRSSKEQRLALLQGIFDTCTCIDYQTSTIEFTNPYERLFDDVRELICSLGMRPAPVKQHDMDTIHKLQVKCYSSEIVPFRLQRHIDRMIPTPLYSEQVDVNKRRMIVNIEPIPSQAAHCITVDNKSHLYLVERSMIPTHNTLSLIDGAVCWLMTSNPSDALIVHMTETSARKFSRMRIARMIRKGPAMKRLMTSNKDDDNILTKFFRNGMALVLGSPAPTNLSASDYKFVFLSDYDRMPNDNGEGNIFVQAQKRTQTFMSAGMTMAESSPGRDFTDNEWKAESPHEAPPVEGILGLYNDGDRRMFYWRCPNCDELFCAKPGLDLFCLPKGPKLLEEIANAGTKAVAKKYAKIYPSCCGAAIEEKHKTNMNSNGVWLKENPDDDNSSASYWLGGVSAKFQTWTSLLDKYFKALVDYNNTGEERKIKAVLNVDFAMPFIPFGITNKLTSKEIEARAEDWDKQVVPEYGRGLFAAIDVQAHHFAVLVMCRLSDGSELLLDRFDIRRSERMVNGELSLLEPASYAEDWNVLTNQVINLRYPIANTELDMGIVMTVCDSGGKEGVTEMAYKFWKSLKKSGLTHKFNLVKGDRPAPGRSMPTIRESVMDKSSSAARNAGTVGQQLVWILNTTVLKDTVSGTLKRMAEGQDKIHFPEWLPSSIYKEMTVETRTDKGWENLVRQPNETFDLLAYCRAAFLIKKSKFGNAEINLDAPPFWLGDHGINPEVSYIGKHEVDKSISRRKVRRIRMKRP